MANRRRTSPKAEPIDLDRELDEMYSSAITRPNLGFLRITDSRTIAASIDNTSIDAASFPTGSDDSQAIDELSTDSASVDLVSMDTISSSMRPAGKWKLHRCSTVQDGHSANEQLLYEMLWRSANEVSPDERILAISREDMARQSRITVRNVKGVLDRLIEKLAVERVLEANSFARLAATYQIYSYRVILERRRKAGLEWVTRANGVRFIPSQMAHDLLNRPKFAQMDSRQPTDTGDTSTTVSVTKDTTANDTVSMETRWIVPPDLGSRLRRINPAFDTAAVASLWRECRLRVTDCTVEEVLHFSNLQVTRMRADHTIRNTIAILLTSVPEFFEESIVHQFRAEQKEKINGSLITG